MASVPVFAGIFGQGAKKPRGAECSPGRGAVLRRYAYSLTTKRTRVYSFCLVTVTPNLAGFLTPAFFKIV